MGALYGYARVSEDDQDGDLQNLVLRNAGCSRANIYTDQGGAGKFINRPSLNRCLRRLRRDDTLLVCRLDRLGYSTRDLIDTVESLKHRGVQFRSLTESVIDTRGPQGDLVFQIFAVFAQFERSLIAERTKAGRVRALKAGQHFGPKFKLDPHRKAAALRRLIAGDPAAQVAQDFKVSRSTLYRSLGKLPPFRNPKLMTRQRLDPNKVFTGGRYTELFASGEKSLGEMRWILIAETDPEAIGELEYLLQETQVQIINRMIENSAMTARLGELIGGRGSNEQRRLALIAASKDPAYLFREPPKWFPDDMKAIMRRSLVEAENPDLIENLEFMMGQSQAEVVDDLIEGGKFVPELVGHRGKPEQRRRALAAALKVLDARELRERKGDDPGKA